MKSIFIVSLICTFFTFNSVSANINYSSDDNYTTYNEIVTDLEKNTKTHTPSYFTDTQLHFGAGYSNSFINLSGSQYANNVHLQGFQVGFGMDFTPNFIMEVSYTNFTPQSRKQREYSMSEYGLRGIFRSHFSEIIAGRLGFGISARNLEVSGADFTTPTSQIFGGTELKFGPKASIIAEIAYKDSFTNNTPERNALDLTVRIDGHF